MEKSISGILSEHKRKIGVTNQWIADTAKVSKATVDRVLSGGAKAPRYETLQAIASAVGCSMASIEGMLPEDEEALQPTSESCPENDLFFAMICSLKDQIADQRDRHDAELRHTRKWLIIVVIVCLTLVGVLVTILMIDILNPNVGWIRGARGAEFARRLVAALEGHS